MGNTAVKSGEGSDFEKDTAAIEGIADKLEHGSLGLDESLALFRQGSALVKKCQKYLENAELVVQKAVEEEGVIELEDFDGEG